MLPTGKKPRVSSLKMLATILEYYQSHRVFIIGMDPNYQRNKRIDRNHMELYTFAANKLFLVLKTSNIQDV